MNTDRCAHHAVFGRPERHIAGQSSDPADQRDPVFAAEEYARLYPDRAALIRRLGRLPDNVTFGPPEDRVVRALVSVHTPALLALDREYA